jgi:regulator of sigma E protease
MDAFFSWFELGLPSFLFVITVVVFFHELGHFLMARCFDVKIQTFSVGFGRELVGFTDKKGTRWKISLLPLGGYVKFFGDADVSSKPDQKSIDEMDAETRSGVLHFKPLHQRALVAAAGPIANFILAIAIFAVVFMIFGRQVVQPIVDQVQPGTAAEEAGFMHGDRILSVNGQTISDFLDVQRVVADNEGAPMTVVVQRNGASVTLHAIPRMVEVDDPIGGKDRKPHLGLQSTDQTTLVRYGPVAATSLAVKQTWYIVDQTLTYLTRVATGKESTRQLSGPIGIMKVSGDVAHLGFLPLINLAALLSVSIGLLNLFPIPVLDGGHLLYYACEAVLGRPLGERAQEVGFRIGLALVLCLMLLATFNDLARFNLF